MSLYATLLLATFVFPFMLSFDKKVAYYKSWGPLFLGISVNAILFIVWDGWFARTGVWGFNPDYVWPIRLNDLPLEEWLFFIIVPYASVFIYSCLKAWVPRDPLAKVKHHLTLFFLMLTFVIAALSTQKTYTFYNALIASVLLLVHYLFLKREWMGYFWLAYMVHLVPFLIVNGILTGAATNEPVVWYNETKIMGPRIYTIPVEDCIYALTCLLLPITIMEWLIKKRES